MKDQNTRPVGEEAWRTRYMKLRAILGRLINDSCEARRSLERLDSEAHADRPYFDDPYFDDSFPQDPTDTNDPNYYG